MNSNRRVLFFVLCSTAILLLVSFLTETFHFKNSTSLNNINLIADILKKDTVTTTDTSGNNSPGIAIAEKPHEDFMLYRKGHFITNFSTDTSSSSLNGFVKKLHDLKTGNKRKIRIAYFGDSMIEGDLLTQTLRKLLQQAFGGNGVGFVPITSQVSQFRQTVTDNYSDEWEDENFKTGKNNRLFFSGHLFHTAGASVQMIDQTVSDSTAIIEKSILCGYVQKPLTIVINNSRVTINPGKAFNRIVTGNDHNTAIKLAVANDQLPVYGISFESSSGIIVDNFSFRGITGVEFASIDSSFLLSIAENNPYDLIVFQYGVNLLFRPNDKNFSWYARAMLPVVKKFRTCFKETDFLLVSTADRAFRYITEYKSAVGIDSLIKVQAALAFETSSSFYNQFETMGGTNSIVDWANRKPSLANRDYVHPNHRGAEVLANYFFEAIMNDYEKYVQSLK
jgi:lysophospholipase L1-like esterase